MALSFPRPLVVFEGLTTASNCPSVMSPQSEVIVSGGHGPPRTWRNRRVPKTLATPRHLFVISENHDLDPAVCDVAMECTPGHFLSSTSTQDVRVV